MNQLRWTLACLGVLFVVWLAWFERRRQRQAARAGAELKTTESAAPTTSVGVFREPTLTLPEMRARDSSPPHDLPVVQIEEDSFKARHSEGGQLSGDRSKPSLPVMDSGPVAQRTRASDAPMTAGEAFSGPVELPPAMLADERVGKPPADEPFIGEHSLVDESLSESTVERVAIDEASLAVGEVSAASEAAVNVAAREVLTEGDEIAGAEGVSAARIVEPPAFKLPAVAVIAEPIVEWPPDELRRVVALRLVAPPPELRLAGRALRLALAAEGFVLGKFSIFHKPDESGRAVMSAASLSKPGTFDLATMDTQRYGGLSLFAVLPGPMPPARTFDELLATSRNLNERLNGALQDERGGPLTSTRIASLRETVSADAPS